MESIRDDLEELLEKKKKTGTVVFSDRDQTKILDSLETQLLKKIENLPKSLPDLKQVASSTSDKLQRADARQIKAQLMEQAKGMAMSLAKRLVAEGVRRLLDELKARLVRMAADVLMDIMGLDSGDGDDGGILNQMVSIWFPESAALIAANGTRVEHASAAPCLGMVPFVRETGLKGSDSNCWLRTSSTTCRIRSLATVCPAWGRRPNRVSRT